MQVKILKLTLRNFKGIAKLDADFNGGNASILATNGIGKTTVFDSFCWLLFGKDSRDRKDFEVKTLDKDNNPIHRLEHSVEALLDVDGIHMSLRRVFKENWVKKRGEITPELAGHETEFYWNDVPLKAKEYSEKVSGMLDEFRYKLLSNPLYLNDIMPWKDRREVLIGMAGYVSDNDVLTSITNKDNAHRIKAIEDVLLQGKKLSEYTAEIAAKKKTIKDKLATIPARLDEVDRSKPEQQDWRNIEESLKVTTHQIQEMQKQLADSSAADRERREKVDTLLRKQDNFKLELRRITHRVSEENLDKTNKRESELQAQQRVLANAQQQLTALQSELQKEKDEVVKCEIVVANRRQMWLHRNAEEFTMEEGLDTCPTCLQKLPETEIEDKKTQLMANFNTNKAADLAHIQKKGLELAEMLEAHKKKVAEIEQQIPATQTQVEDAEAVLSSIQQAMLNVMGEDKKPEDEADYKVAADEIAKIDAEIAELKGNDASSTQEKQEEIAKFTKAADELKARLQKRDEIKRCDDRKAELLEEEKKMSQELANLEADEYTMQQFERSKMDMVEQRVNGMFEKARFKMFNQLLNGGFEPTCELVYEGVPWSNLNKAGTILLGLDCIKTISKYYEAQLPIFIDNAESVVVPLPDMDGSQMIRLVAREEYNELTFVKQ